jgi:hypothetical protein
MREEIELLEEFLDVFKHFPSWNPRIMHKIQQYLGRPENGPFRDDDEALWMPVQPSVIEPNLE